MKKCEECGTTKNIEKHSLSGNHKPPFRNLCTECHDKLEGHTPKNLIKTLRKKIRRAKRRIKRDEKIIKAAREQLGMLEIQERV